MSPCSLKADLLAFQFTHFSDNTAPEDWFMDAQTALEYDPSLEVWEDDGLGYYDDGVKRTLTDEQIAIFRHSEMEQLKREERRANEAMSSADEAASGAQQESSTRSAPPPSRIEEELIGLAPVNKAQAVRPASTPSLPPGPSMPTDFGTSKDAKPLSAKRSVTPLPQASKRKPREAEVPYDQRNKRKWEEHVVKIDRTPGQNHAHSEVNKTANRMLRELDEIKTEEVDLDY